VTYRLLVLTGAFTVLLAQESSREPQFADYPAAVVHGAPAAPKLATAGQRRFRTEIRDWAEKGPNFAGHYTVAEWGCGAGCAQFAVVDNQSGTVYEGPFGSLPKALVCFGDLDVDHSGIAYRDNSSLLVLKGCPNNKACGAYYYQWTSNQWKLLRHVPMKAATGC
jgi:hypothetical protein